MNFIKLFISRLLKQNQLATNESILLFEKNMLADSEFYQDVESWGGNKIAADVRA